MQEVLVKNADRMMTAATLTREGIQLTFADGCSGVIPFPDLPEIKDRADVKSLELPNPYELVVTVSGGGRHEIPWDFARHYCDPSYRPRVEAVAERGRLSLGERVRAMRTAAGMTQEGLSSAAGIARVTLVRLESGEQSPRYETLVAIARALGRPVAELLPAG
jgi:DNA-binding XRE family transcriptional regulator